VGLQTRAKFIVQTHAGQIESSTHILRQWKEQAKQAKK
jgi:hypothetical protein